MGKHKLYLDDTREAPEGWKRCRWPQDIIEMFEFYDPGQIEAISLDHDLGEEGPGARTGKDVLTYIMDQVINNPEFILPKIYIHTANPYEMEAMRKTKYRIHELYKERESNKLTQT